MAEDYICPKCTEKLKRNVKHKPGSQVFTDHLKYIQKTEVIIGENEAIPEDIVKQLMNPETSESIQIFEKTDSGKSIFVINTRPQEVDLATIPPNVTYVQTSQGLMSIVREETGKVAGLFDPEWTISKANFKAARWEFYVPDPKAPQCRRFVEEPFTEREKLKHAALIARARHKHYPWIQKVMDAKKLRDLENHAKPE